MFKKIKNTVSPYVKPVLTVLCLVSIPILVYFLVGCFTDEKKPTITPEALYQQQIENIKNQNTFQQEALKLAKSQAENQKAVLDLTKTQTDHRAKRLELYKEQLEIQKKQNPETSSNKLLAMEIYDKNNNQKILTFDQLFGMQTEKEKLLSIQDFLKDPTSAQEYGINAPSGVILYSNVPGVGKTVLAQGLSKETGLPLIQINAPDIFDKLKGQANKKVKELFAKARELAPSIIFVDECEGVLADLSRLGVSNETANVVNTFKAELTSLKNDPQKPIFFIGATNHITKIDEAVLSRMGESIEVHVLDLNARKDFLKFMMKKKYVKYSDEAKEYHTEVIAPLLDFLPNMNYLSQRKLIQHLNEASLLAFKSKSPKVEKEHVYRSFINQFDKQDQETIIQKLQEIENKAKPNRLETVYEKDGYYAVKEYDSQTGNQIKETNFTSNNNIESFEEFDPITGKKIKKTDYNVDDGTLDSIEEYDPQTGRIIKSFTYNPDGSVKDMTERERGSEDILIITHYKTNGKVEAITRMHPTDDKIFLHTTYNDDGSVKETFTSNSKP